MEVTKATAARTKRVLATLGALLLTGCMGSQGVQPAIDPDAARAEIARLMPAGITNREGWAIDIFAAFEHLRVTPSAENVCAVIAVTEQESGFKANPAVPGLPAIARREIDTRAARYSVPKFLVSAALEIKSPNGQRYSDRIAKATTEKDLSDIFEDFIGSVPLGKQLFADLNPVHTAGPMQVSIAFAEKHAMEKSYPYTLAGSTRAEVFTRRGGLYFGIAHLFDYPVDYDAMLFRFADYNAGHYASRNAAFQNALGMLTGTTLAMDGDLVRYDGTASNTEVAARKLATRLDLNKEEIHAELERGDSDKFERTKLYTRVFELAEKKRGADLPRAVVPKISLKSPKITRSLTTDWFAHRVDGRYQRCLTRVTAPTRA
jgi:hypothetical protein